MYTVTSDKSAFKIILALTYQHYSSDADYSII